MVTIDRPQPKALQTVHIKQEIWQRERPCNGVWEEFKVTTLASGQNRTFEHITWNVQVNKKLLSITGIYCPPPNDRVTNSIY